MSPTRDQKRFTISEMAADWHELMISQRICSHPLLAPASRGAASRHINHWFSLLPLSPRYATTCCRPI